MDTAHELSARWTQDEAIEFQAARDCITHLLAIRLARHRELESLGNQAAAELASLDTEILRLLEERRQLRLKDHAEIARIRVDYGEMVRRSLGAS